MSETTKPNCYNCVHRREVPGSAHSACGHPVAQPVGQKSPFMNLAGIVGKRGGNDLVAMASFFGEGPERAMNALHVKGAELGVRRGWFIWPVNFDPVWLENCDGFAAKDTSVKRTAVSG